jgi:hypothetical protein
VKTILAIARSHLLNKASIAPLFLLALLLTIASDSVAQGGKAEPLRVQFKRGSTSATFTGTVRGTEQFEYVLAATKGQWMFVEVNSAPLDSAMLLVKNPGADDETYQYSWSGTLTQTGDCLISVSKPPAYKTATFTLTITVSSRPPVIRNQAKDADSLALYAAMRKFIDALSKRDTKTFLSLFSRTRPSYHLNPMNVGSKEYFRDPITYSRLNADIRKKEGLYWLYVARGENGSYDAFVDNLPNKKMWTRVKGNKFVPPGAEVSSYTYVRWRKEGGRWVIDEISYATA